MILGWLLKRISNYEGVFSIFLYVNIPWRIIPSQPGSISLWLSMVNGSHVGVPGIPLPLWRKHHDFKCGLVSSPASEFLSFSPSSSFCPPEKEGARELQRTVSDLLPIFLSLHYSPASSSLSVAHVPCGRSSTRLICKCLLHQLEDLQPGNHSIS